MALVCRGVSDTGGGVDRLFMIATQHRVEEVPLVTKAIGRVNRKDAPEAQR